MIQNNEIRTEIAKLKKEISQINKEYSSKTVGIKVEIKNRYDDKIKELKTNFKKELANLDSIAVQINALREKEKAVQKNLKLISKEITNISDLRDQNIKLEIKKINKGRKKQIKEINENIKVLKKKL